MVPTASLWVGNINPDGLCSVFNGYLEKVFQGTYQQCVEFIKNHG